MPFRVFREAGWIGGVEMDADEIADRVDIFVAGQPVVGDAAAVRQASRLAFLKP